ncbi:TetR family transcriptional regulator [Phenylobacterium sp. Root77]|jgi:AcrR family transcriptional regulator|uniref:TetR/AcrR family transcriptional regulator n=1 Tax=unclassified Phenylobacterium TaxID=2640670 RepID=UPI0006FD13A6|nr:MULTISPECIES: TetR/AcrR family transcriptional regulator [unclassified Phenylobacterium]KQW73397.1 TetR family transcriptional regulator [Phenylobacterium sp. Root1277]KQW92616.1 TetR family transcriptional regulator [Phenylobacterium sp. Root1290]KRC40844.1 TetR family transcriptional regulator [Phenylobacterium sp. Root77]
MKHVSSNIEVTGEAQVRVPTRRALAKQQTRAKVLAAARRLFSESGYEGATIRDIAAEAGMSTGAVFANFTDKSDLFREIMVADMEALVDAMRDGVARGRGVDDTLLKLFVAGYAFYKSRLPLARAAFGISWMPEQGQELRDLAPVQILQELFTEQLNLGVERGELSQEAEVKLRSQMLFDCYLANFQEAIFGGWSLEALQAKSKDQIRVILAGARRG